MARLACLISSIPLLLLDFYRYLKGMLPKNPAPTIGVEFATKNVSLKNGQIIKAQIWDTGNYLTILMIYSGAREIQSHMQCVSLFIHITSSYSDITAEL